MNEPTRPNFQFHRAHPVAGPGVEPDDWVIPTDKPAGGPAPRGFTAGGSKTSGASKRREARLMGRPV